MKMKTKKLLSYGLSLAMLTSVFAGCSSKTEESASTDTAKVEEREEPKEEVKENKSDEKITLSLAASQNWIVDVDKELAKAFEEETGIAIDFQLSPDDQYQTIIKSKLNTGEGPDIYMTYSGTKLRDFNPEKNMVDLSNEPWVDNLEQWAIDGNSLNGVLYAQNTAGVDDTNGVLYKPALFEKLGIKVPTNYTEFKEACDKLSEAGITPVYEFVKDLWHTHYWMEGVSALAVQNDPDLYKKLNTNEIGFADVPEYVKALEQLQEMEASGYFGENHMSNIYDNSYDAINSEKYGMIIIHGSYPNEIASTIEGSNPDEYSMFPNPLVDNTMITLTAGGTTKCINASSSKIDAAKEYFNFLAREENVKKLYAEKTMYVSSSMKGIDASPTKAFKDLREVASGELQGAEASVYFYDGGKISELCQEMFVGLLTPTEVLQEFDNSRRAIASDAGQEGF
ncbi:MAG: ABC transporter substrate-binding protein [Lachnospirales bacterium]